MLFSRVRKRRFVRLFPLRESKAVGPAFVFGRKMFAFLLVATLCISCIQAQGTEVSVPDNSTECVNYLIRWCNGTNFPQEGGGRSFIKFLYKDNANLCEVSCFVDSNGTNCTRNGNPWFACTPPDHTLTYKGQVLSNSSAASVDGDICKTADMVSNQLALQNFNRDTMKELRDRWLEEIEDFRRELMEMHRRFMGRDGYGGFFPDDSDSDSEEASDEDESTSKEKNDIEREE